MNLDILEIFGQIADLKDADYKNTLAIAVLIELLIDKNLFSRQEFAVKARELECATVAELALKRRQVQIGWKKTHFKHKEHKEVPKDTKIFSNNPFVVFVSA